MYIVLHCFTVTMGNSSVITDNHTVALMYRIVYEEGFGDVGEPSLKIYKVDGKGEDIETSLSLKFYNAQDGCISGFLKDINEVMENSQ